MRRGYIRHLGEMAIPQVVEVSPEAAPSRRALVNRPAPADGPGTCSFQPDEV